MVELRRVVTGGGVEVAYELWAAGQGAPVVLFGHGLYSDRKTSSKCEAFREMAHHMGWAFCALDFYGRGDTSGDFAKTGATKCVECLEAVISALSGAADVDGNRVALVGSSFGGLASLLYAARRPDTIKALVLIAPALNLCDNPVVAQVLPGFDAEFYADLAAQKPFEEAASVAAPTLIIQGDADDVVPQEVAKRLVSVIPGAELLMLPGVGHSLPPGRSKIVMVEAVCNFLKRHL